jgi:hypothetical protein
MYEYINMRISEDDVVTRIFGRKKEDVTLYRKNYKMSPLHVLLFM